MTSFLTNGARRRRSRWLAMAAVALLLAAPTFAAATRTWQSPYQWSASILEQPVGCNKGIGEANKNTGRLQVYANGCNGGGVDTLSWVGGSRFDTNQGETLESWKVPVTAQYSVSGTTACSGLGSQAYVSVSLTKWRLEQSQWHQKAAVELGRWSCVADAGTQAFSFAGSGSGEFWFDPGWPYRMVVEAKAHALASATGTSTADMCTNSANQCGGTPTDQHATATSVTMANAPPKTRFDGGGPYWFAWAYAFPPTASGKGCDPDHHLTQLKVEISGPGYHHSSTFEPGDDPQPVCLDGLVKYEMTAPLTYHGWANGTDNEGAAGTHDGRIQLQILPFNLGETVPGFPDLSTIPSSSLGNLVTVDVRLGADGEVRAYRVTSDGKLLMSTWSSAAPLPGDQLVKVEYDRLLQVSWTKIGSQQIWSGGVVPVDANAWWKFRAVADVDFGEDSSPATESPPPEPTIRTMPDEQGPESVSN